MIVYMPKFETPKSDKVFVVVLNMEIGFPIDFRIESTILAVKSEKALLHTVVSLLIPHKKQEMRGSPSP